MKAEHIMNFFRPTSEPARSLFDALVRQMEARATNSGDWIHAERAAMLSAAQEYAHAHGLRAPTPDEVESAERSACGHSDYAAKWAYGVADAMRRTGA